MYDFVLTYAFIFPSKHLGVEWLNILKLCAHLLETLQIVFQSSCAILPSPSACPPPEWEFQLVFLPVANLPWFNFVFN